jgi:hypothetical protein
MAFYEIEPFGDEVADLRHGTTAALMANLNRDPATRPAPYRPHDFIHWGQAVRSDEVEEPVLLDDPVAQSNLMRAMMFGKSPKSGNAETS